MDNIPISIVVILFSKMTAISIATLLFKDKKIKYNSRL